MSGLCNEELKSRGADVVPRSCHKCGLGPCKEKYVKTDRQHEPLKQIAGLIQKLSYRDMQTLAKVIGKNWPNPNPGATLIVEATLKAADEILAPASTDIKEADKADLNRIGDMRRFVR